ncbi:thioredoxin family protein [Nonlabens ponticola]|uniref:Thioredoxin n=1 Tax=Nonlabens ponticola TaxID=2496866 RepID=A0A3S9MUB3_9FLAO|nr:thioredoxin family protein [Nonlabens ponticola]AZQ42765.1 thioredoxin [Nonlabens ponticola]
MKKILLAAATATILSSCGTQKEAAQSTEEATTVAVVEMETEMGEEIEEETEIEPVISTVIDGHLRGLHNKDAFMEAPYSTWFVPEYESYTPDATVVNDLKTAMNGVEVRAFMGTWCGDSKRETPKFFKLMDQVGFDADNINLIAVDRSKQEPVALVDGFDVKRVPTFIFYRDGEELGRFVEYPRETLEKDIFKIVSGADYKHSYED